MYTIKNVFLFASALLFSMPMIAAQQDSKKASVQSAYSWRKAVSFASGAIGLGLIGFSLYDATVYNRPAEMKSIAAGIGCLAGAKVLYPARNETEPAIKAIVKWNRHLDDEVRYLARRSQKRVSGVYFRVKSNERTVQLQNELDFLNDSANTTMRLNSFGSQAAVKVQPIAVPVASRPLALQTTRNSISNVKPVKPIFSLPFIAHNKQNQTEDSAGSTDAGQPTQTITYACTSEADKMMLPPAATMSASAQTPHSLSQELKREIETANGDMPSANNPILESMKKQNEEELQKQLNTILNFDWNVSPDGTINLNFVSKQAQNYIEQQQKLKKKNASAQEHQANNSNISSIESMAYQSLAVRKTGDRYTDTLPAGFMLSMLRTDNLSGEVDPHEQLVHLTVNIEAIAVTDQEPKIKKIVERICTLHAKRAISVEPAINMLKEKMTQIGNCNTTAYVDPTDPKKGRKNMPYRHWMQRNFENEFAVNAYKPFIPLVHAQILSADDLIALCEQLGSAKIDTTKAESMRKRITDGMQKLNTQKN